MVFLALFLQKTNMWRRGMTLADMAVIFCVLTVAGGAMIGIYADWKMGYTRIDYQPWDWSLIRTYMAIFLYILGLIFSNYLTMRTVRPERRERVGNSLFYMITRMDDLRPFTVVIIYLGIWVTRLFTFSAGGGISGFAGADLGFRIPYLVIVLQFILNPASVFIILYAVYRAFYSKRRTFGYFLPLLLEFVFLMGQGRRDLIIAVFGSIFVVFAVKRKIPLLKLLFLGMAGFLLIQIYSARFLDIRERTAQLKREQGNISAFAALQQAFTQMQDTDMSEGQSEAIYDNAMRNLQVRGRTSVFEIYRIFNAQEAIPAMHGEAMYSAFMKSLPRALRPIKYWFDHALFILRHYNLSGGDISDTFVLMGVADAGLFGAFFVGTLVGIFLNWCGVLSVRYLDSLPIVGILVYCAGFDLAVNYETSASSLFVAFRNVVIILIATRILNRLGIISFKPRDQRVPLSGRRLHA